MKAIAAAAAIAIVATAAACGKPQQPKVEITKPLEAAKNIEGDLIRKSQDDLKKADELSK